jgi:uncharacterized membrane protein YphA (DoxX/SURF4 family)
MSAVFAYSGWVKIMRPERFVKSIASFRLFPEFLVGPMSYFIPAWELSLALLWLFSSRRKFCAGLAVGTCTGFLIVLSGARLCGVDARCGCFGGNWADTIVDPILRDIFFLILSIFGWILETESDDRKRV